MVFNITFEWTKTFPHSTKSLACWLLRWMMAFSAQYDAIEVSIPLNKNSEEAKIYLYSIIVLSYICFKSNPLCRSQDSNCSHTNSKVSLIVKIAIKLSKCLSWIFLIITFFGRHWCWHERGAWEYIFCWMWNIVHHIQLFW